MHLIVTFSLADHGLVWFSSSNFKLFLFFIDEKAFKDRLNQELEHLSQATWQSKFGRSLKLNAEVAACLTPWSEDWMHEGAITALNSLEDIEFNQMGVIISSVVPAQGIQ